MITNTRKSSPLGLSFEKTGLSDTSKVSFRASWRRAALLVAPTPLLLSAATAGVMDYAMRAFVFAMVIFSVWLLGEGMKAEDAYNEKSVSKPPAIPRKIIAAVIMGMALTLVISSNNGSPIEAAAFGLIAGAMQMVAFGLDPRHSKGLEGVDGFSYERVYRLVGDAEKYLIEMRDAVKGTENSLLINMVERYISTAENLFSVLEDNPEGLDSSRKFLSVYPMAARDATVKFARLYRDPVDIESLKKFKQLLADLEAQFEIQTQKALETGKVSLDIEMELLRDRLTQ